jgi:hypothetical protein
MDLVESIFIEISMSTFKFTLGSIYSPGKRRKSDQDSEKKVKSDLAKLLSRPGPFVLAGDWNAKHINWNNHSNDERGKFLDRHCENNLCKVGFSEETTFFPGAGRKLSLLDFVVSKGVVGISKPIVINDLSADHVPISFEIPTSSADFPDDLKTRNFAKANWKLFRQKLASLEVTKRSLQIRSIHDIDENVNVFVSTVKHAIEEAIPLKRPHTFRYPFSRRIDHLRKRKNAMRDLVRKFPHQTIYSYLVNDLKREIRFETQFLKEQHHQKNVSSLNVDDGSLFRAASNAVRKRGPEIQPLNVSDDPDKEIFVYSSTDKANALAQVFHASHMISEIPTEHSDEVQNTVNFVNGAEADFPELEKISCREVKAEVESLKIRKAPGHDNIPNCVLKNLSSSAFEFLTIIYNACLRASYFPLDWKIGKVVAISKPGKDRKLPRNYRPITLLSTIGKIFEKLILNRLLDFEAEKRILKDQQFGFRSKHSTTQQIVRIVETAALRFSENKSTAMVMLDIAKAFDSVWHEALVHKLHTYAFPMYLVKMIKSFLENRISNVTVDGKSSDEYSVPAGSPQGSPLSPFLYNISTNDMPVPKHCKLAVYADDTALVSSITNYEFPVLVDRMASGLAEIGDYFSSWKVNINSEKTEAILFTKSTKMIKLRETHKIHFNETLEWKDQVRYLGVMLDTKLTFKSHIDSCRKKAGMVTKFLFPLMKRTSSLSQQGKITLYRSYIRPVMTYACPVFSNCADCHMKRLQIFENKCLRMALNAPYRTRITSLHGRSRIPMIKSFVKQLTDKFYQKCAYSTNKLVSRLGDYSRLSCRSKHRLPRPD